MRVLVILCLSLLIIVASLFFFAFCMCAADARVGGHLSAVERVEYATAALAVLGGIIGMARLIRKLNRTIGL